MVIPLACSVAAVVTMMKKAMRLEKNIPIQVSKEIREKKFPAGGGD